MSSPSFTFGSRIEEALRLSARLRAAALGEILVDLAAASPPHASPTGALAIDPVEPLSRSGANGSVRESNRVSPGDFAGFADTIVLALLELVAAADEPATVAQRLMRASTKAAGEIALAALLRGWCVVPVDKRSVAIAAGRDEWGVLLGLCAGDPRGFVRAGCAEFIADAADAAHAHAAAQMLADPDALVARRAADALVVLALHAAPAPELGTAEMLGALRPLGVVPARSEPFTDADRGVLAHAIHQALRSLEKHKQRGVVLAAAILLSRGFCRTAPAGPLLEALCDKDSAAGVAARSMLRRSTLPLLRARGVEWLAEEPWANAAAARMARATTLLEHEALLSRAHLLHRAARARHMAQVAAESKEGVVAPGGALPRGVLLRALEVNARRMVPLLTQSVKASPATVRAALDPLFADHDAGVRLACVHRGPAADRADWAFDKDARVARAAFLRWSLAGTLREEASPPADYARLLSLHERSADRAIAAWAAAERRVYEPGASLSYWIGMRREVERDPEGVAARLRTALNGPLAEREHALAVIRRCGLAARMEQDLLDTARVLIDRGMRGVQALNSQAPGAGDTRTLASIISVLGSAGLARGGRGRGEEARALFESVLRGGVRTNPDAPYADARVRANAVEALAAGGALPAVVMELKNDPHHRVRSTTIRALLRAGTITPAEAQSAGEAMLEGSEADRKAARWLLARV